MSTSLKLNLRRSLGYTTDVDGFIACIYSPSADRNFIYASSHGFGWDTAYDGSRDRGTNGEPSLHGIHFASSPRYFRLDLPNGAGNYKVYAVACDQSGSATVNWGLYDGTSVSSFFDWTGSTSGSTDTLDIAGNSVSVASWTVTGNGYVEKTFTQDHLIMKPLASGVEISAIWVEESGGAATNYNPFRNAKYINKTYQIPRFG